MLFQALRRSGAKSSIAPPAIGRNIKASRKPLGAISKYCASHWVQHQAIALHQAQYQSIVPAIGRNIKASRRIRRDIKASCHHWA
jgi:hypothetical protein